MSFLTKYLPKKKKLELKKKRHVRRDWFLSLAVFFGATILLSLLSFFVFFQVSSKDVYEHESTINIERLIDQELLNNTIILNEEKREQFEKYQSNGIDIPTL